MTLHCVGMSHRTAPVAVRERWAVDPGYSTRVLGDEGYRAELHDAGVRGLILLSTCNRSELYATGAETSATAQLLALLARATGADARVALPYAYHLRERAALDHLCRVASGLDSMVPGEAEILGQVGEARSRAAELQISDPALEGAFETAVRAGRRARTETVLGRGTASVASAAVARVVAELGALTPRTIVLLGTGRMARAMATLFRDAGVHDLRVVGRDPGGAARLEAWDRCRLVPWAALDRQLAEADAVLAATAAPHPVLTRADLEAAGRTPSRPLLVVDIGVPRNVEPGLGEVPGVQLLDLDGLQARIDATLDARRRAVPQVEAIIREELDRFEQRRRGDALRPILAGLHARAEGIRREELQRVLRRFGPVSPEVEAQFESFSLSLVAKLLDPPSRRLRGTTDGSRSLAWGEALRELFDLRGEGAGRS